MNKPLNFDLDRELKRWALDGARKALKVKKLHQLADKVAEHALLETAKPECEKGCSKCCHYRVDITQTEAEILAEFTGRQMQIPERPSEMFEKPTPCPFLVDDACSVYPARPLQCRSYFTLVPPEGSNLASCRAVTLEDYRTAKLNVLRSPQKLIAALLQLEGNAPHFGDIRDYFPR